MDKHWMKQARFGLCGCWLLALLAFSVKSADAAEYLKPPPAMSQPISVGVTGDNLSSWSDMPAGTYAIPDSQVRVAGHQNIGTGSLAFGIFGVMASISSNSATGEKLVRDTEEKLKIKLNDRVLAVAKDLIASEAFREKYAIEKANNASSVLFTPGLVLTFATDTEVIPYIVLKTHLRDSGGSEVWMSRYLIPAGKPRPMIGEGGWMDNDGVALNDAIQSGLEAGLRFALNDIRAPYPRDTNSKVYVVTRMTYLRTRVRGAFLKLMEDERFIAISFRAGGLTGIHLLDKAGITEVRPPKDDDRGFDIVAPDTK